MIKHFPNHFRVIILHMNTVKILLFILLLLSGCAPNVKVIARYPNSQEKSTEIFNSKLLGSALKQRLTYYSNGKIKTETNFSNNFKHGKFFSYHSNGSYAVKGKYKFDKRDGKWEWTNQNKLIDSIYNYNNGVLHGKHENYNNGNIEIRQQYHTGKLNGGFTEYFSDGSIKTKGKYYNDIPHSKWEWFDENQNKTRLINYASGIKNGNFKVWSDDTLRLSGIYLSDKRHGAWKWYHSDKKLDSLVNYNNGELSGEYKIWYKNNALKVSGVFTNGKRNGEWKWLSENKHLDSTKIFSSDKLDGITNIYYKNGQLKSKRTYSMDHLDGESVSFYISGQLESKTYYKKSKKMGPFEVWLSSGRLEEKGVYVNDQYNGPIQRNYSTGQLASIATYKDGILDGISQIFTPSNFLKKEVFYNTGKEISRLEYHDNGRFKRVLIFEDGLKVYERKWNIDGFENTDQIFITGTRTQADYYISGQLKYECIYKGQLKHGMEWWFDEQRNPLKVNLYNCLLYTSPSPRD